MLNQIMMSKLATFSECNLPLPCSTVRFVRMGYMFDLKTGSIKCSSCEFVVELKSPCKDVKSALESIQSQHKIKSPQCLYLQDDSGSTFEETNMDMDIRDFGGVSKVLEKNGRKINILTDDLEQILLKSKNAILKRTVESMRTQVESREKLKNVDISGTSSSDDNNIAHDVTDSASAVTRSATAILTSPGPTDAEILQKSKHPALAYEVERRKTFNGQEHKYGHMATTGDKIKQFVDAGFYYIGPNDNVRCFFCDGGLVNFRDDDDPWAEHKRWYADCLYIKYRESLELMQRDRPNIFNNGDGQAHRTAGNISSLLFKPVRALDTREIEARLETPIIQTLLLFGYQREHIRRALERRLTSVGDDFKSAEEILEDILQAEGDAGLPWPGQNSADASTAAGAQNLAAPAHQASSENYTAGRVRIATSLTAENVDGIDDTDRPCVELESEMIDTLVAGTTTAATGATG